MMFLMSRNDLNLSFKQTEKCSCLTERKLKLRCGSTTLGVLDVTSLVMDWRPALDPPPGVSWDLIKQELKSMKNPSIFTHAHISLQSLVSLFIEH